MKEKKNIMKYNTEDIYKIIDNEDYLKESKMQYLTEKEARQKRLEVYAEKIQ